MPSDHGHRMEILEQAWSQEKAQGGEQLGDAYSFLRGETGQVVLKAKVHFIEDAEMDDADIPAKPAYVPIEYSLGTAPAISTSTVVGSSLKGMAFVQLFKLATIPSSQSSATWRRVCVTLTLVMESSTRYVLSYRSITIIRVDSSYLASLD